MVGLSTSGKAGRVALVQGASRGLGLEFVRQLAARDDTAAVLATCRDPSTATDLRELADIDDRIIVLPLDVADEDSIIVAADAVAELVDRLDLLINTAGLLHEGDQRPERRLRELRADWLARSFAVNAIGPVLMARHFESLLFRSEAAVFASLSARVGSITDNRLGGWYGYRASKAAQNMFTKTLAVEWARRPRPVTCLALHPGTVDTDLSRPFQGNVRPDKLFDVERAVRQLIAIIDAAGPEDSGRFIAWDGQDVPY